MRWLFDSSSVLAHMAPYPSGRSGERGCCYRGVGVAEYSSRDDLRECDQGARANPQWWVAYGGTGPKANDSASSENASRATAALTRQAHRALDTEAVVRIEF